MFDRWEYTIPANTGEADALRVECPVSPGFLKSLTVYFPPGCQNRARCRVLVGARHVAPLTPANYIAAEGMAVHIQYLNEPIKEDLPVLNWELWNIDETHNHTIWMSAQWISEYEPYDKKTARLMQRFIRAVERLLGVSM